MSGLAARTKAVRERLAHLERTRDQTGSHGEHWGAIVTVELIRRDQQELAWLAELAELAEQ